MASNALELAALNGIKEIRDHYVKQTTDPSGKKKKRNPANPPPVAVASLETEFVAWINDVLSNQPDSYTIKASAGQENRSFVKIPYAAILRDGLSTPTKGLYVVVLFNEDMSGIWLSLNQGNSDYETRFESKAKAELLKSAKAISSVLPKPEGFARGPIKLQATTAFGKAYEQGAVLSKRYPLAGFELQELSVLKADFLKILKIYQAVPIAAAIDPSIVSVSEQVLNDEDLFQDEANAATSAVVLPVPPDSIKPPPKTGSASKRATYARDPDVAAIALVASGFKCELDTTHKTFTSKKTGKQYFEVHHLVPLAQQKKLTTASLDVHTNLFSLCPNCHAAIHRSATVERDVLITHLFDSRSTRLPLAGINFALDDILKMY